MWLRRPEIGLLDWTSATPFGSLPPHGDVAPDRGFRQPAVTSRRRWAFIRAALLASLMGWAVLDDVDAGHGYGEVDRGDEYVVTGRVVARGHGRHVTYRHPVTDQLVTADLPAWAVAAPPVGRIVELVVDADPLSPQLLGDRFGPKANWTLHLTFAALALLNLLPWWSARRSKQLVSSPPSHPSAIGVVTERRHWLRRSVDLDLYEAGARIGERPLCTVPILTLPAVAADVPFAVVIHGRPRRWRRVVATTRGPDPITMWPRQRALWAPRGIFTGRNPIAASGWTPITPPSRFDGLVSRRTLRAPAFWVALGAALAGWTTVVTLQNAEAAREFDQRAERRIAEVVGYRDEDTVVELRLIDGDQRTVRVTAEIEAQEYPIGTRYEILVDPDADKRAARLVAEPYDAAEPIIWGAVLLVVSSLWLLVRQLGRRAVIVAARRGPWRRVRATLDPSPTVSTLSLLGHGGAIGWVTIESGSDPTAMEPEVVVAGEPGPGLSLAVWRDDGAPLATIGPLRMPSTLPPADPVESEAVDGPGAAVLALQPNPIVGANPFARSSRRQFVRVSAQCIEIYAPQWFGRTVWRVPTTGCAFEDLGALDDSADAAPAIEDELTEGELTEAPLIPYLVSATQWSAPTTTLLFATPQRVPQLPWWMLGSSSVIPWLAARSSTGVAIDGVQVQFTDPTRATATLQAAGLTPVTDSTYWLRRHREVTTEPSHMAEIARRRRRRVILSMLTLVGPAAGLVTIFIAGDDAGWPPIVGGIVMMGLPGTLGTIARIVDARRRGRALADDDVTTS